MIPSTIPAEMETAPIAVITSGFDSPCIIAEHRSFLVALSRCSSWSPPTNSAIEAFYDGA
jgi:hypothetical protein